MAEKTKIDWNIAKLTNTLWTVWADNLNSDYDAKENPEKFQEGLGAMMGFAQYLVAELDINLSAIEEYARAYRRNFETVERVQIRRDLVEKERQKKEVPTNGEEEDKGQAANGWKGQEDDEEGGAPAGVG